MSIRFSGLSSSAICHATLPIFLMASGSVAVFGQRNCNSLSLTAIVRSGVPEWIFDQYGESAGANQSVMVIGAPARGTLHLFGQENGLWNSHQTLQIPGDPNAVALGDAVAVHGDTIVAGIPRSGEGGYAGMVYVFVRDGTNWVLQQRIQPDDHAAGQLFGYSVAISHDVLLAGAIGDNGAAGAAYLFSRNGSNWVQTAKLATSEGQHRDRFGWAVSLDGERALVGSASYAGQAGRGFIFKNTASVWELEAVLIPDDVRLVLDYGVSLALSGNQVAINSPESNPKAVHIFRREGTTWARTQKLVAQHPLLERGFGLGVALSSDRLVVGSPATTLYGRYVGVAHVFTNSGAAWVEQQTVMPLPDVAEQFFAHVVTLTPNGVLIPNVGQAFNLDRRGVAYLFEYDTAPPVIHSVEAKPSILWPPNGKLVPVDVAIQGSDDCSSIECRIVSITVTEPTDSRNAGHKGPDWEITSALTANLRASRQAGGTNRVYTLTVECKDSTGKTATAETTVIVPHDQRQQSRKVKHPDKLKLPFGK